MYCNRTDLTDYVLDAYLVAAESKTAGVVDKTIGNVTGEINDALRGRYALPLPHVPDTIKRIASVVAAYRIVGAITSIVNSEGASNNEWIPLQTQYKQALRDLDAVRDGKITLDVPAPTGETDKSQSIIVVTRKSAGLADKWSR